MRERSAELGATVWIGILSIVLIAILAFGGFAINRTLYPAWMGVQREAVQQSKSFVDSTGTTLANLKTEHGRLQVKIAETEKPEAVAVYKAQQQQVVEQMCTIVATMDKSTVDRSIINFINEEGGC